MSAAPVRWTKRATRRLDQIGAYISKESPQSAARVVRRIAESAQTLARYPEMGRAGRVEGTRELPFADIPYILAYRVSGGCVEILTIIHAAQRWPEEM